MSRKKKQAQKEGMNFELPIKIVLWGIASYFFFTTPLLKDKLSLKDSAIKLGNNIKDSLLNTVESATIGEVVGLIQGNNDLADE